MRINNTRVGRTSLQARRQESRMDIDYDADAILMEKAIQDLYYNWETIEEVMAGKSDVEYDNVDYELYEVYSAIFHLAKKLKIKLPS